MMPAKRQAGSGVFWYIASGFWPESAARKKTSVNIYYVFLLNHKPDMFCGNYFSSTLHEAHKIYLLLAG